MRCLCATAPCHPLPLCAGGDSRKRSHSGGGVTPGALGRIRTGDAHLRRVALYPLSYGGLRRPAYAWLSHRPPFWPALVRAPERKAARRSAPAFALLLGRAFNASVHAPRRRECSNTLLLYGTSCVPACPRPDSNRRRPPPEGGALSAELRGRMPPPRDDARKTSSGLESCTSALQYSPPLRDGGFSVRPMVFNARSTRTLLITRPTTSYRISLPISRSYANCGRAPRGIRTHNPRFKRPLL